VGGSLSDVLGRRKILLASVLATPVLVMLFLLSGPWVRAVMLVLIGFFVLSVTPVLMALVQENFPENRSLANGSFMTLSFLTNTLGLAVVGFAGDHFGLQVTYSASALLMLLAVPTVLLFPKDQTT
jgi:FSR family fosmidomycin resistance protein-like MFS transporter